MKRIISLLLVLSLCLAVIPVTASAKTAPEMVLNINYDDEISHLSPTSLTMSGDGSVNYVMKTGAGKALMVKNKWSDTFITYNVSTTGTFWLDVGMKGEDRNVERRLFEFYVNGTLDPRALLTVSRSGQLIDSEGNTYGFIDPTVEHRYTARVYQSISRYDLYIDGKMIAQRIPLTAEAAGTIAKMGFSMGANADKEGNTLIDYFRVYKADEFPELSDFPAVHFDAREKTLRKANVKEPEAKGQQMLYSEDFESVAIGTRQPMIIWTGGNMGVQEDSEGNRYLLMNPEPGTSLNWNWDLPGMQLKDLPAEVIYQFDIRCKKVSVPLRLGVFRDQYDGVGADTLWLQTNGQITVGQYGASIGASCFNKWVNVALTLDFKKHTYDVYVNGVKTISGADLANSSNPRYHLRIGNMQAVSSDFEVMYDNFRLYTGTKVTMGELEQAKLGYDPMPVPEKVWEHEITETPLKIDMSKFSLVPDLERSKYSTFLYKQYENMPSNFDGTIVFAHNTSNMWIKNAKYTTSNPVIHWDDERYLAPVATLAALTSEKAEISGSTVTIGNFTAKVGEKKIVVDGTAYDTAIATRRLEGTIYIPIKEYTIYKLKKYYSECEHGIALIADKPFDLEREDLERSHIVPMIAWLTLDRPNVTKLKADFEKVTGTGTHPRIFGSTDKIKQIFEAAKTDGKLKSLVEDLVAWAERALSYKFSTGGHTIKNSSFEVVEAYYVAYLYTGNEEFVRKAKELAFLLTDMGTWKEDSYYLDVSTWLTVCAEVYDLFYHQLTQEERDRIATRMIELGLQSAQDHYYGRKSDWPTRLGNWNTVCNGGPVVAAAALYGDGYNDELCLDVLEKVPDSLSYCIWEYSPHGGVQESGHYWEFGTEYLTRAIDVYEHVFGTSYGLADYSGMEEIGYFAFYLGTSSGDWAFHDDPPSYDWGRVNSSYACWSAYRSGDLNLQRLRYDRLEKDKSQHIYFYDVFYYQPDSNPKPGVVELDHTAEHLEMAFSRNDVNLGEEQFWVGIHALKNNGPHLQWDLGNFVYEAYGVRFAKDYGRTDYGGTDIGGGEGENSAKGQLYPSRTEAHNLFVIAPSEYPGQLYDTEGKIIEIGKTPVSAAYKVDLTSAYWPWVTAAQRGYMFTNNRTSLIIQDEIHLREDYEGEMIKWFWHTYATAKVNPDKSVTLSRDGARVTLYFDSNVDFDVEAKKAGPMESSPSVEGDFKSSQQADSNKIEVTFYGDVLDVTFRCIAMPIGWEMERGEIVPIDEWTVPDGELTVKNAKLEMIYVDGEPLEDFKPNVRSYQINGSFLREGYPEITAKVAGGGKVTVINDYDPELVTSQNNTTTIFVEGVDGGKSCYGITFKDDSIYGAPTKGHYYAPIKVEADSSDGNLAEGAIDRNLETRWTGGSMNSGWFQLEYEEEIEFDALVLGVNAGNARKNKFDIQVSTDGVNWTTLKDAMESGGKTWHYEIINLPLTRAKYIKLNVFGADTSGYNSYTEIQFWKLN